MKILDKILLFLLLTITMAAAIALIILETGLLPYTGISDIFMNTPFHDTVKLIVILCAVVLILIDIRLFVAAFIVGKHDTDNISSINKTQIESSDFGASFITISALNTMAYKRCMAFRFVNDCTTNVTVVSNGIIVAVKVVPIPDINLPESMRELQASLKNTLEEQAGIKVVEIPILILPQNTAKQRTNAF